MVATLSSSANMHSKFTPREIHNTLSAFHVFYIHGIGMHGNGLAASWPQIFLWYCLRLFNARAHSRYIRAFLIGSGENSFIAPSILEAVDIVVVTRLL